MVGKLSELTDPSALVRHDNTGKLQPGIIGASATQRQWIGLSLTGDEVTVEPISPAPPYLQSIDMEVGFLRRGHEVAEQFSADEMAHNFIKGFSGIVLAAGEILVFEFHGQNLKAVVKGLHTLDLPTKPGVAEPRRAHTHIPHGILMEKTDVTFIKAADSSIKIKSSARKYDAALRMHMVRS